MHFALLGAMVFAGQAVMGPRPRAAAKIVADSGVRARLGEDFRRRTGRGPSPGELARAVDEWLDEEALYRRALELGLHETDLVVRRELVQRMRFLMEDVAPVAEPTDAELRGYLALHPDRFAARARWSFEHAFFSRGARGEHLTPDAKTALLALRAAPNTAVASDPFFNGAGMAGAAGEAIARSYGQRFADVVAELPVGIWSGPVESAFGLHLVRVSAVGRDPAPRLEDVRPAVVAEVKNQRRETGNRRALDALRGELGLEPARGPS